MMLWPDNSGDFPVRPETVVAMVLAGGASRRMEGGDKALMPLAGRPLIAHVLDRLPSSLGAVVLNVNDGRERYLQFGLPIVPDADPAARLGPLAGVLAGMDWASKRHGFRWLLTVPTDAPFLPPDLLNVLSVAVERQRRPLAIAESGGRRHPVVGLWSLGLQSALRRAHSDDGELRVGRVVDLIGAAVGLWSGGGIDPFLNVNNPEDLTAAEAHLAGS